MRKDKRSVSKNSLPRKSRKRKSRVDAETKGTESFPGCSSLTTRRKLDMQDQPRRINYFCGGCGILYEESEDDWIRCLGYAEWWEIECAGLIGKSKREKDNFHCPDCV